MRNCVDDAPSPGEARTRPIYEEIGTENITNFPGENMVDERMQNPYISNRGSEFKLTIIFQ